MYCRMKLFLFLMASCACTWTKAQESSDSNTELLVGADSGRYKVVAIANPYKNLPPAPVTPSDYFHPTTARPREQIKVTYVTSDNRKLEYKPTPPADGIKFVMDKNDSSDHTRPQYVPHRVTPEYQPTTPAYPTTPRAIAFQPTPKLEFEPISKDGENERSNDILVGAIHVTPKSASRPKKKSKPKPKPTPKILQRPKGAPKHKQDFHQKQKLSKPKPKPKTQPPRPFLAEITVEKKSEPIANKPPPTFSYEPTRRPKKQKKQKTRPKDRSREETNNVITQDDLGDRGSSRTGQNDVSITVYDPRPRFRKYKKTRVKYNKNKQNARAQKSYSKAFRSKYENKKKYKTTKKYQTTKKAATTKTSKSKSYPKVPKESVNNEKREPTKKPFESSVEGYQSEDKEFDTVKRAYGSSYTPPWEKPDYKKPQPVYKPKPVYIPPPEPTYEPKPVYKPKPVYNPKPVYKPKPTYHPTPKYKVPFTAYPEFKSLPEIEPKHTPEAIYKQPPPPPPTYSKPPPPPSYAKHPSPAYSKPPPPPSTYSKPPPPQPKYSEPSLEPVKFKSFSPKNDKVYHPSPSPYDHREETYEARPYSFNYGVKDKYSGVDYNRAESRSDNGVTKGSYKVALPDGRLQIVTYFGN